MHTITPKALYALLKPYERIKFTQPRTGPRVHVDVLHRADSVDADIRTVTSEGIEVFFYNSCELVPFENIERITIRSDGSSQVFAVSERLAA